MRTQYRYVFHNNTELNGIVFEHRHFDVWTFKDPMSIIVLFHEKLNLMLYDLFDLIKWELPYLFLLIKLYSIKKEKSFKAIKIWINKVEVIKIMVRIKEN